MKLKEINEVIVTRERYLKNLQNLEALLNSNKDLANEIEDKARLTIPLDTLLAEIRGAYYSTKIAKIKKALDEAEVSISLDN